MEKELRIRERAAELDPRVTRKPKPVAMVSSLLSNSSRQVRCSFCNQDHMSVSCPKVTGVEARKEILRKSGRCFVCLRRNHISRNCRSSLKCNTCNGRHHVSICPNRMPTTPSDPQNHQTEDVVPSTNLYVGTHCCRQRLLPH